MLEKPAIKDKTIRLALKEYGLTIQTIDFLPLGADLDTAVYRARSPDGVSYFVKLRRGKPKPAAVLVPSFLAKSGMTQVLPAMETRNGILWLEVDGYFMTVYPFIEGHNGYQEQMSEPQWVEFGTALKRLHTMKFPPEIVEDIPAEKFSTQWSDELRAFLARCEDTKFTNPEAVELAMFLKSVMTETLSLIDRALAHLQPLRINPPKFVLCHADIHCWNLLIEDRTGAVYIVDWDTLIFAPKERDLMFIGAGLGDSGYTPEQEAEMFFQGYGATTINRDAITYYRCARIIEDIAISCRQIFLSDEGGEDRKQTIEYVRTNFRPGGTIARTQ